MKLFFICLSLVYSLNPFNQGELNQFVELINKERKVDKLSLNVNLTKSLEKFVELGGSDWGYKDSNETDGAYKRVNNFRTLLYNDTFLKIISEYNDLKDLKFLEIAHDTFVDNGKTNTALKILRMRTSQRHCYQYIKCSNSSFTNYRTCSKLKITNEYNIARPCQWFYFYYPRFISPLVKDLAIVKLQIRGRFAPIKRQNNAWLIVFNMLRKQSNDKE